MLELAARSKASALVIGSSSKGPLGRISLGSVTRPARALRPAAGGGARPPRFRAGPSARIRRVSIGYGGSKDGGHVAVAGARLAESLGAPARVVTFAVRPPKRFFGGVGESADELVIDRWVTRMKDALVRQVGELAPGRLADRLARSLVVGDGVSWAHAIWGRRVGRRRPARRRAELVGPRRADLLGSRASKIVRSAPVPVYLVPAPRRH